MGIKAKQIEAEVEIEKQRKAAEHVKAMREQKAKESGGNSSTVVAGIDPVLHNNIVADLRQEISSLKEQLTLKGNDNSEGINAVESINIRGKRSLEDSKIVEIKDQSTSTEDLIVLEDRLYDDKLENWEFEEDEAVKELDEVISRYSDSDSGYDELLEDSSNTSSISSSDTNAFVSEASLQSQPITSATVRDALVDVEKELQSKSLAEDQEVEAVENILDQEIITDTGGSPVQANSSTTGHQEVLAERARFVARAREDLRFGSKMLSKQIRHRLLTREIGSMMAVAAGDEEQEQAPSYSV